MNFILSYYYQSGHNVQLERFLYNVSFSLFQTRIVTSVNLQ